MGGHEEVKLVLPWGGIKDMRKVLLILWRSLRDTAEEQEVLQWDGIRHILILNSQALVL